MSFVKFLKNCDLGSKFSITDEFLVKFPFKKCIHVLYLKNSF